MCGMCGDTIAGCDQLECGALPPVDENGNRRSFHMRWYQLDEIPCCHVLAEHKPACAVGRGSHCDCRDAEDDE